MNACRNKVDVSPIRSENSQLSENQEIVNILMGIILYLLKWDIPMVIKFFWRTHLLIKEIF